MSRRDTWRRVCSFGLTSDHFCLFDCCLLDHYSDQTAGKATVRAKTQKQASVWWAWTQLKNQNQRVFFLNGFLKEMCNSWLVEFCQLTEYLISLENPIKRFSVRKRHLVMCYSSSSVFTDLASLRKWHTVSNCSSQTPLSTSRAAVYKHWNLTEGIRCLTWWNGGHHYEMYDSSE